MNSRRHAVCWRLGLGVLSSVLWGLPAVTSHSSEPEAVVIQVDPAGRIDVRPLPSGPPPDRSVPGVVIWSSDAGAEAWRPLGKVATWPPARDVASAVSEFTSAAVRSAPRDSAAGGDDATFADVVQLEQLATDTLTRAAVLVSPRHNAELVQPQIIFRRPPEGSGDKAFPPRVAIVSEARGNREVVKVRFPAGQAEVPWDTVTGAAPELAHGLPAGRYLVRLEQAGEQTEFTVLEPAQRQEVWRPIEEFAALTGDRADPLFWQFAVTRLLTDRGRDGVPLYLTDAWMLLARLPEASLTPYLVGLRGQLLNWLERLAQDPGAGGGQLVTGPADQATGVPEIDQVRNLLGAGRWDEALADLDRVRQPTGTKPAARAAALAELYRAVILAEAGLGQEQEATAAFQQALESLDNAPAADRYRGLVNYGNFLLHQAQDRLHNLSFQMAAGVAQPLLSALRSWRAAHQQYQAALDIARQLDDRAEIAAVQVNLARLYTLLADVVRTLDADPEARALADVEAAAVRTADHYASQVTDADQKSAADAATRAVAHEIRAHLAFRAGDTAACRQHAGAARQQYIQIGRLAGVESVARLCGLLERSAGDPQQALQQFLLAQALAELLRERFPPDQVGLSRAGFFARRSYVYEQLVELLIATGKPAEALRYAELAKARTAQDFLAAGGIKSRGRGTGDVLSGLLQRWPRDTAALEYFLGSRQGWVFLVNTAGNVQAAALADQSGQPLASRDLIGRVRTFLAGMENQAEKMTRAIMAGRGLEQAWQDDLHAFAKTLVPDALLAQLRKAQTVVVVPHHILHYFPFAALVTKPDPQKRSGLDMARPAFLVDEPFQLLYAPSLVTWQLLNEQPRKPIGQVTAVGIAEVPGAPALPGVTQDLENLRAVFGERVRKVYEGEEAREGGAKQALRQRGLLLLATHGFNDPDQPLESHLLFLPEESEAARSVADSGPATGDRNDGRLTAREVFATPVRAEMVVMNACYSGLGDRSPLPGDDLFGLQRAFLQAGTRTVVSGLWDVYDGTAPQLMDGFFRRVASGLPASAALAESQRAFLHELRQAKQVQPWLHPYFWAVFTVAGADGSS